MNKVSATNLTKVRATLDAYAIILGQDRRTMARTLKRNDVDVAKGKLYTIPEIVSGLIGAEQIEKVRNLKLDADAKEREAKIESGELVTWEDVNKDLSQAVSSLGAALDAAPEGVSRDWIEKVVRPAMRQVLKLGTERKMAA